MWKLPHYFQAHTVMVLTQLPFQSLLWKTDYTRRAAKWLMILGAFDIKYMPRTSIKGQVLTNLVTEFAEPSFEENDKRSSMDGKSVRMVSLKEPLSWKVYVDGIANQRGSGVGLVIVSPKRIIIKKSLRLGFSATNNEAEHEALLVGMAMVQKMGGRVVEMFSDSRLVVSQVKGELKARYMRIQDYLNQAGHLQLGFNSFSLHQIPRSRNTHANSLATLATSLAHSLPRVILVKNLCNPTKMEREKVQIHQLKIGPSWIDPIVLFLKDDILLEEKGETDKVRRKAPQFKLSEDLKLYKCSFSGRYLLCIHPETMELLLEELHEGICTSHTRGRSLSHRALT